MDADRYGLPASGEDRIAGRRRRFRQAGLVLGCLMIGMNVLLLGFGMAEQPQGLAMRASLAPALRAPVQPRRAATPAAAPAPTILRRQPAAPAIDLAKARMAAVMARRPAPKPKPRPVVRVVHAPAVDAEAATLHPVGSGTASYYGRELEGRPTASGEPFSPDGFTAAHPSLPFGSLVRVTNTRNGRAVVVRINDRGPFSPRRVIDLSTAAAREIGMVRSGTAHVEIELIKQ